MMGCRWADLGSKNFRKIAELGSEIFEQEKAVHAVFYRTNLNSYCVKILENIKNFLRVTSAG